MKTIRKKIGGWVEMAYDDRRKRLGLIWLRVKGGFGQRGDREDWVADVPSGCLSVSKWDGENWKAGFTEYRTFDSAITAAVRNRIREVKIDLCRLANETDAAKETLAMLKKSLTT